MFRDQNFGSNYLTLVHISSWLAVLPLANAGSLEGALGVALSPPGGVGGSLRGDGGVAHRETPPGVEAGGALGGVGSQGEAEGVASVCLHAHPHPCRYRPAEKMHPNSSKSQ